MVAAGEAVGADATKTPPSLRRRKRACSRRQGDKEKEREAGGSGPGERGDRGVGEDRDRREAGKPWQPESDAHAILCAMLPSSGVSGSCTNEAQTFISRPCGHILRRKKKKEAPDFLIRFHNSTLM